MENPLISCDLNIFFPFRQIISPRQSRCASEPIGNKPAISAEWLKQKTLRLARGGAVSFD
jgi:hypothetical protein